jgi:hypothetical protein
LGLPPLRCTEYFGYLSERSREVEIPEECITCPKSVGCILHRLRTAATMVEETEEWHPKEACTTRYGTAHQHQPLPPLESLLVFP